MHLSVCQRSREGPAATLKIGAARSEEDAWPIKQSEASEPPLALAPPAAAATGSALRVVDATCACRAVTVEERSLSAAVRLVCLFSATFATMFMSRRSVVTVPSSAKRPAERDSSQQHAAPRCDAGSTTWDRLVGLDRPDLRAVLGRLVQDQRHRGEGAEWQRVWARLALSEPPERLLDRRCAPG